MTGYEGGDAAGSTVSAVDSSPIDPHLAVTGGLRPSFSSLGCGDLEYDAVLALADRHGLPEIEIRTLGGTVDLPAYFAATFGSPDALLVPMPGRTARVAMVGTSLRIIGNKPQDRDQFLKYVPWALRLGARYLRVFDGGSTGDAGEMAQADETLAWWQEVRAAHGWQIAIAVETHDAFTDVERLQAFVERHQEVAILWDTHHTWRRCAELPSATWRRIAASVVHLHVKDSLPEPTAKLGYVNTRPGEGDYPLADLLTVLRENRFQGLLSLEWERFWHPELPPLGDVLPDYLRLLHLNEGSNP